MAISYEFQYNKIGEAVTTVPALVATSYAITGLDSSSNYQFRVRAQDTTSSVIIYSAWSSWSAFTTAAVATPVVVSLGTINNSVTLNNVTPNIEVPPVIVTTYDLYVGVTGQVGTTYNDSTTTSYALSGLTDNTNYTFKVRKKVTIDGAIYYTPWVTTTFDTLVTSSPITVNLGVISSNVSLNSITATVSEPTSYVLTYELRLEEVGIITTYATGIASPSYTLTSLNQGSNYLVSVRAKYDSTTGIYYSPWTANASFFIAAPNDVVVTLGTISSSITLNNISADVSTPTVAGTVTHYAVSVYEMPAHTFVKGYVRYTPSLSITGLNDDTNYQVEVIGITNQGGSSNPATYSFSTPLNSIIYTLNTTESSPQTLDLFRVTRQHTYDKNTGILRLYGTTTHVLDTLVLNFNGTNVSAHINGLNWEAYYASGEIHLPMMDELDGTFAIQINLNGDTLGF